MKKINIARLEMLINKSEKCVDELNQFYNILLSKKYEENPIIERSMELSFRSLFNSFQSLVEDYISMVLRTVSVDVSKKFFKDCLDLCIENKFLSEDFVLGFKPSVKLRNDIAHGYDIPTKEVLMEFYGHNQHIYTLFIENIVEFKKSLNNEEFF